MLADTTQGGIPYRDALNMTGVVRRAAIGVIKDIRKRQEEKTTKKRKRKGVEE